MKNTDMDFNYITEPHIVLISNSKCIIDGLQGICEYTAEKIKINLGKYAVVIVGSGLYIESFSHEGAVVEGDILSLEMSSND